MANKIFNIPFSLDFMEDVDIDKMAICEGIFNGFKFSQLKDGIVFFKNIDGVLVSTKISNEEFCDGSNSESIFQNIKQMPNQKETKTINPTKCLDENMIVRSFIGKFADQCAEKVWSLALENFKCKDEKRRVFKFNKRSVPKEMLLMPSLFYKISAVPAQTTEKEILNLGEKGYKKVEKIVYHEKVNNVLQEIEQSVDDNLCCRCNEFEKQNAKYMDEGTQRDLEEQASYALLAFFKTLEKNVLDKGLDK